MRKIIQGFEFKLPGDQDWGSEVKLLGPSTDGTGDPVEILFQINWEGEDIEFTVDPHELFGISYAALQLLERIETGQTLLSDHPKGETSVRRKS